MLLKIIDMIERKRICDMRNIYHGVLYTWSGHSDQTSKLLYHKRDKTENLEKRQNDITFVIYVTVKVGNQSNRDMTTLIG